MNRLLLVIILFLFCPVAALAVPVLQVGAPAGADDVGSYADYIGSLTDPTEEDTAVTYGNTIYAAGVYQNDKVLNLGGEYNDLGDWEAVDSNYAVFNNYGAVLLVAVPDGSLATALASLTINGGYAFYSSATLSGLFPNDHAPLKDTVSDYLFFDIGDFSDNDGAVPDFAGAEETGSADGEIKTLTINIADGTEGLDWIHFDLLALETSTEGQKKVVTTIEANPGSHDVTWKYDDGGGGTTQDLTSPEPATFMLFGIGLLGLARVSRRKNDSDLSMS